MSDVRSSVWSQELKLGPSNPPIWKWDVFWSDKRSSEVIFFGTRTFYLFILFWTGRLLLFCECRTKILESEKFFLLSVPKDDAVIKCWNTPSLISHMLHIHILLWCSIYYTKFKLHFIQRAFSTDTILKSLQYLLMKVAIFFENL